MAEAICSGIFNDLGSGSNVDVCVITKVKIKAARLFSTRMFHSYKHYFLRVKQST